MKKRNNPERDQAFGTSTPGRSLTEPEHADSCDINKMVASALRGAQIRGGPSAEYGYDDTTLDGVSFRIQKSELESSLSKTASLHAFTEEELNQIPDEVRKRFDFKKKPENSEIPQRVSNDDKTTKNDPKGFKNNPKIKQSSKSSGNVPEDSSEPDDSSSKS